MGDKSCPTEYKGELKNLECHLTLNGWGGGGEGGNIRFYIELYGGDQMNFIVT